MPFATAIDFGKFKLERTLDERENFGRVHADSSMSSNLSDLSNDNICESGNFCKQSQGLNKSSILDINISEGINE